MAAVTYARAVLKKAAEQWANRLAIVEKQGPKMVFENAHGTEAVKGLGSTTAPYWGYTGPSNRVLVTDPHDAALCVCLVYHFLKGKPKIWRFVFTQVYIRDQYLPRLRREEREMLEALGKYIGDVPNEQTIVDEILREIRLESIARERESTRRRVQAHRARKACNGSEMPSCAQEMATVAAA